jgi:hypothetical protein
MRKKYEQKKYIFSLASLKSMKKGVGSGVGSGSISQRYGSGDPDPHQNVTDPNTDCNCMSKHKISDLVFELLT